MVKRLFDILAACALLLVFLPIIVCAAALILLCMGRPIFLRQVRPGHRERLFVIYKFRTMTNERDASGQLLSDVKRITPVGRFLRMTSIDELPQLWNVLRGDMSLVGPRPLLVRYLPRYTSEQRRRHEVRPGITGLAQISGRNILNWDDRFRLDVFYVDHRTLMLDMKILALTLWKTIRRSGLDPEGGSNFGEFWGTQSKPTDAPTSLPVEEDLGLLNKR